VKLVNPNFLAMIDDLFYMLSFNDRARMESLQKKALVKQEMATFLAQDLRWMKIYTTLIQ
jgi:hypothetical protein